MVKTRDHFERWFSERSGPRKPKDEASLLAAADAFDSIQKRRKVTPQLLEPIVAACAWPPTSLSANASRFLSILANQYVEAGHAVEMMASDGRWQVRFNAVLCARKEAPVDLNVKILRIALRDKSARVRGMAACHAGILEIQELICDLEQALKCEKDPKAKDSIDFELKLLRDGFTVEPASKGQFVVCTRFNRGTTSRFVSKAELDRLGPKAIAKKMRKEHDRLFPPR